MSNKATLKGYFVTGALPTQANFDDLIESTQQQLVVPQTSLTLSDNSGGGQTLSLVNARDGSTAVNTWIGTQSQYDAITTKSASTIYYITD